MAESRLPENEFINNAMKLIHEIERLQRRAAMVRDQLTTYQSIAIDQLDETERESLLLQLKAFQEHPKTLKTQQTELLETQRKIPVMIGALTAEESQRIHELELLSRKISVALELISPADKDINESITKFSGESKEAPHIKSMETLVKLATLQIHDAVATDNSAEKYLDKLYAPALKEWRKQNPEEIKILERMVVESLAHNLTEYCKKELSKMSFDKNKSLKSQSAIANAYFYRVDVHVQNCILEYDSAEMRAHVMARWINVAHECFKQGDFQTLVAIYSAFLSEPIHLLHQTKEQLDDEAKKTLKYLEDLFQMSKGYYEKLENHISQQIESARNENRPSNVIPHFAALRVKEDRLDAKLQLQSSDSQTLQVPKASESSLSRVSSSASITATLTDASPSIPKKNIKEKQDNFLSSYKEIQKNTIKEETEAVGIQKVIQELPVLDEEERERTVIERLTIAKKLEPKTPEEKDERGKSESLMQKLSSSISSLKPKGRGR